MSLITLLGDIPLYSTVQEAEAWGATFGIQGYHNHIYQGQVGYMSGANHQDIELALSTLDASLNVVSTPQAITSALQVDVEQPDIVEEIIDVEQQSIPVVTTIPVITTVTPTPSSGGGGGGGY